jgi:hypothetical protein
MLSFSGVEWAHSERSPQHVKLVRMGNPDGLFRVGQLDERRAGRKVTGYQLLWLDQLALASDNAVHAAAAGLGGIDTSGTLFYNGATAAVEFDW